MNELAARGSELAGQRAGGGGHRPIRIIYVLSSSGDLEARVEGAPSPRATGLKCRVQDDDDYANAKTMCELDSRGLRLHQHCLTSKRRLRGLSLEALYWLRRSLSPPDVRLFIFVTSRDLMS